jgi:hypothetical protein
VRSRVSTIAQRVTRLVLALLAVAGLGVAEAGLGGTIEAAPCEVLHLTSMTGPSRLDPGATGAYTVTVTNPNVGAGCDNGLQIRINTVGSLRPTGEIHGSAGTACTEEPPGPFSGVYRCVAPSLPSGATATITASIQADVTESGRIDAFAWSPRNDHQPPHGHEFGYRTLTVNEQVSRVAPTVRMGASGGTVTTMQYLLRHHGQDLAVDGDFGPQTEQAIRDFQRAKGLAADGVVGPRTWAALFATVQRGSEGDAVRAVQSQLVARGFDVEVDGDFGRQTDQAVRSYQKSKGLGVDGVVGSQTWTALVAAE